MNGWSAFNSLKSLPPGVFDSLTQLKEFIPFLFHPPLHSFYLYLDNNRLSSLDSGVFNKLNNLNILYLTLNHHSTFTASSFIFVWFLFHNNLSSLPSGLFNGLNSLTTLELHTQSSFHIHLFLIQFHMVFVCQWYFFPPFWSIQWTEQSDHS